MVGTKWLELIYGASSSPFSILSSGGSTRNIIWSCWCTRRLIPRIRPDYSVRCKHNTFLLFFVFPLPALLIYLHYLSACTIYLSALLILFSVKMNDLPRCVHPDLPRHEFIQTISHFPVSELLSIRLALFHEALTVHSLVPPELTSIPLVNRRDTAIKPASIKLSEDVWSIVHCITNRELLPRTLFKNGKRSKDYLSQVTSTQCDINPSNLSVANSSQCVPSSFTGVITTSQVASAPPPSGDDVSRHFITRDLNRLKDDIISVKSDIAAISRANTCSSSCNSMGEEILSVKRDLAALRDRVCCISPQLHTTSTVHTSHVNPHVNSTDKHHIDITTWNCRGFSNAIPYLNQLIGYGTDVIALCEHWLWPFDLPKLEQLHPDYAGFGISDKRLSNNSDLSRGCGGVGLVWKKSLAANPINIDSDRICGVQLELNDSTLTILSIYLPSTDHSLEEYTTYVNEIDSAVSAFQTQGPVILAGDFNAHLPISSSTPNPQGNLIFDLIDRNHLYPVPCADTNKDIDYTFFSGCNKSKIDYIFIDATMASGVISSQILDHHPLNFSDHLPVSLILKTSEVMSRAKPSASPKINWSLAMSSGSIDLYAERVQSQLTPLLHTSLLSVIDIDSEIQLVSSILIEVARETLPQVKHSNRGFVLDHKLAALCKLSKIAWRK